MLVKVVEEAVPRRATVAVSLEAASLINKEPVRVPAAEGLKVTLTEQLAAAASVVPQEFDWVKSLEFDPEILMEAIDRASVPEFLTDIFLGAAEDPME